MAIQYDSNVFLSLVGAAPEYALHVEHVATEAQVFTSRFSIVLVRRSVPWEALDQTIGTNVTGVNGGNKATSTTSSTSVVENHSATCALTGTSKKEVVHTSRMLLLEHQTTSHGSSAFPFHPLWP